jgi:hypothetical protein
MLHMDPLAGPIQTQLHPNLGKGPKPFSDSAI